MAVALRDLLDETLDRKLSKDRKSKDLKRLTLLEYGDKPFYRQIHYYKSHKKSFYVFSNQGYAFKIVSRLRDVYKFQYRQGHPTAIFGKISVRKTI